MRNYIFLTVLMSSSLFASDSLNEEAQNENLSTNYHTRDYTKGPISHVEAMNNIEDAIYEDYRDHAVKHALTYNFEIAKKNDTEYFFKQYLTPMMEKVLSNINKFDIDQRFEISALEEKFHNFKRFSERYYDFQESLVAFNTDILALDVLTSIMTLYQNSQEEISVEISKFYELIKDKSSSDTTESTIEN